jgi:hypothetical protein
MDDLREDPEKVAADIITQGTQGLKFASEAENRIVNILNAYRASQQSYLKAKEEVEQLKAHSENGKEFIIKDGVYYDQDGDGPFCTGCYDTKKRPIRLVRQPRVFETFGKYKCPSCKEHYGSTV